MSGLSKVEMSALESAAAKLPAPRRRTMPEDLLTMSAKEVDRAGLIRRVLEGWLPQKKAAEMMGLTARQVRRMSCAYEQRGPRGLITGKRGKPSNNQRLQSIRQDVLALLRERYADFGPTLATEKLRELHRFFVSKMMSNCLRDQA